VFYLSFYLKLIIDIDIIDKKRVKMKNLVKKIVLLVALYAAPLFSEYSFSYKNAPDGSLIVDTIMNVSSEQECKKVCVDAGGTATENGKQIGDSSFWCRCQGATKYTIPAVPKIPNDVATFTYTQALGGKTITEAAKNIESGCSKVCTENSKKAAAVGRDGKTYDDIELLMTSVQGKTVIQGAVVNARIDCYCK
jgi:hypothetical protein